MTRKLRLKKDTLTALDAREMAGVGGGGDGRDAYPTQNCTLPVNQCLLSIGPECQYTDYPSCNLVISMGC